MALCHTVLKNPKISSKVILDGVFDLNQLTLVLPKTKVTPHDLSANR